MADDLTREDLEKQFGGGDLTRDQLQREFAPTPKPGTAQAGPPGPTGTASELGDMLREKDVNYNRGADMGIRMQYFQTRSDDEVRSLLQRRYGLNNFRQDRFGNWLVRDKGSAEWYPVLPKGVIEGLKNVGALGVEEGPQIAGAVAGGLAGGAVGGPPGAVLGAMGGGGATEFANEAEKTEQGFGTPEAIPGRVAGAAATAGGFEAAGPVGRAIKKPALDLASRLFKNVSGVTPETRAIALRLQRLGPGATPPLMSVAPNLRAFAYDRYLRNMLTKDPRQAGRIAALDERTTEVLRGFGLDGADLAKARLAVQDHSAALSGQEGGAGIVKALQDREKQEVDKLEALRADEMANRGEAEKALQRASDILFQRGTRSISNVGDVGGRAARVLEHERGLFADQMNEAYHQIHQMNPDPVVPTAAIVQQARAVANGMDPQMVPAQVRLFLTEGAPLLMTIEQAHNLRTTLRQLSPAPDLSPIGQRYGQMRAMAGAVDQALLDAGRFAGRSVAEELRNADARYSEGIKVFDLPGVNKLVQQVRAGATPNPTEVADMLLDKKSAEAARRVWDILPEELRADVIDIDFGRMVKDSSIIDATGRRTVNPAAFANALAEREELGFVYPAAITRPLEDISNMMQALHGNIDITALPETGSATTWGQNVRRFIEQAVGAKKALEEQTVKSGKGAIDGLRSNDEGLKKTGASYFIAPGNEPRTLAGMNLLGRDSPQWKDVQRYAAQELLNQAMGKVPGRAGGRTVGGKAIADYLGKLTPNQQLALYGDRLQDIKYLAEEAQALFPEMDEQFGASLAAAAILGHLPRTSAVRKWTWSQATGWLGDRPGLVQALVGVLKTDPPKGRAILSYIMQGGANLAESQMTGGTDQGADKTFSGLHGPVPKDPKTAMPQMPRIYGP